MKKPYSLDMSIQRDTDRLKAVEDILDTLEKDPSPTDLEQMASYILYGKDENGKNAIQRGDVTDGNKRYKSFLRQEDKNESLDAILENPLQTQTNLQDWETKRVYTKKAQIIARPKYDKKGNLIDPGDSDIPFMKELWERIDYLEHVVAVNEGKVPADDTVTILKDNYRLYQLKHQLIDLRRHQYYLKDYYKPTLHFTSIQFPQPQTVNWDQDTFYWIPYEEWRNRVANSYRSIPTSLDKYETRETAEGALEVKWIVRRQQFDWENPRHIAALMNHYSAIYMQLQEKVDSWGRTLIYDFDRYVDMCNFSPLRLHLLTRKIDKMPYPEIIEELERDWGITYRDTHLSVILQKEIPRAIATAAKKHRLILETPRSQCKKCCRCKRWLPRDPLFFGHNIRRLDGFSSHCKECDKKRRIELGVQSEDDRRVKTTKVPEVQADQTNS